jgi:hypothetical protein
MKWCFARRAAGRVSVARQIGDAWAHCCLHAEGTHVRGLDPSVFLRGAPRFFVPSVVEILLITRCKPRGWARQGYRALFHAKVDSQPENPSRALAR